MIDAMINIMCV